MKPFRLAIALLFVVSGTAAAANGGGYVELEKRLTPDELASVGLTPTQLERLDALLRAAELRETTTRGATLQADPAPDASRFVGLDATPVAARVHGTIDGWSPGTVFALDNGQQWKVLKGTVTLSRPVEAPTVRLVPGVMGRWFLELDEDHPKARVYRID